MHYNTYNMWKFKDFEKDPYNLEFAAKLSETWTMFNDELIFKTINQQVGRGIYRRLIHERNQFLNWVKYMCDQKKDEFLKKKISFRQADEDIDQLKLVLPWLDGWNIEKTAEKLWNE